MSPSGNPFFSVILPVYNGTRWLREAVESVRAQTDLDWELVIVDDCSTDETPALIRELAASDARIRTIRNSRNLNCGPSANEGIRIARGVWITRIDADDRYRPEYLATLRRHAEPAAGRRIFYSTWVNVIDDDGASVVVDRVAGGERVKRMMKVENFLYHPATSYPRALWAEAGGYPPVEVTKSDDRYLWTRFFALGASVEVIPEPLVEYRIHMGNMSFAVRNGAAPDAAALHAYRKSVEWRLSLLLRNGKNAEARRFLREHAPRAGLSGFKNGLYTALAHNPAASSRFFFQAFRPYVSHWLRARRTAKAPR